MGSVHSIDKTTELGRFFDYLYGDHKGFVYSPTKDIHTGSFKQYFFEWPTGRAKLIQHVMTKTEDLDVYTSVALFKKADKAEKQDILGTRFVWTEFDGNVPSLDGSTSQPSIRIQSSVSGREHWYWELPSFIDDINVIEKITQKIAYSLKADLSCWDANQVLRPPGTIHQESEKTVSVLHMAPGSVTPLEYFATLPDLPAKQLKIGDINHIPQPVDVLATTGPWSQEHVEFFRERTMEKGHRSSALTKLGFLCIEYGLTNAQALSILKNADDRWKKFTSRQNQKKHLIEIINFCRSQKPIDAIEEETKTKFKIYTYDEFRNTKIKLEWVVPNLLHRKGFMIISGPPGVGKSTIMIRLQEGMARGGEWLKWKIPKPIRTLFVSMEMPHEELDYFYDQMMMQSDPGFSDNFMILPVGRAIPLTSKIAQHELTKAIEEFQPEGIWFDSFGRAASDDINSEKIIFNMLEYIDAIRNEYGLFVGFVHHNRKAQIGNKKPNKLDDLFGSQYIGAAATTGVGLWTDKQKGPIEVNCLKLRLAAPFNPFVIERIPGMNFEIQYEQALSTANTSLLGGSLNGGNNGNSSSSSDLIIPSGGLGDSI